MLSFMNIAPINTPASVRPSQKANIDHAPMGSDGEDDVLKSKLVNDLKKTPPLLQRKSSGSIRLLKQQQPVIKEAVNIMIWLGCNVVITYLKCSIRFDSVFRN